MAGLAKWADYAYLLLKPMYLTVYLYLCIAFRRD